MSLNPENRKLLSDYISHKQYYEELNELAYQKINQMIEDNHFFISGVQHRVKAESSLAEKLERKSGKYHHILDVTDLCGFRIICYFPDTVDQLADTIRSLFVVDEQNSVDKRKALSVNQFGYMSLHFICSLKDDGKTAPELLKIRFEIQIRTVLQHAWAEIEHDLGYKSDFGVPRQIRRDFSRVAGLLEIADLQFAEIRDKAQEYLADVQASIADNRADEIDLNRPSLREYMKINKEILAFREELSRDLQKGFENTDPELFVVQLEWLGCETIGDVAERFERNRDYIYNRFKDRSNAQPINVMTTNMILRYLVQAELIRGDYSKRKLKDFYSLTMDEPSQIKRSIQRIINEKERFQQMEQSSEWYWQGPD